MIPYGLGHYKLHCTCCATPKPSRARERRVADIVIAESLDAMQPSQEERDEELSALVAAALDWDPLGDSLDVIVKRGS